MPISVDGVTCIMADGVRELTDTVGQGTYSLRGARTIAGVTYRTVVAGIGSGNRSIFTVRLGAEWETFVGTVTSGTPAQLTREQIKSSSNGNNAVNWGPGDKDLVLGVPAAVFHSLQADINTRWVRPNALPAMFVDSRARQTAAGATSYEFTSIASDVRQIILTLSNWRVGTGGTPSALIVQVGTSGGYVGSGYVAQCAGINSSLGAGYFSAANGFPITVQGGSNVDVYGSAILTRHGSGNDFWVAQSSANNATSALHGSGAVNTGAAITRVRLLSAGGTDTFSAGTIACNIFYGTV